MHGEKGRYDDIADNYVHPPESATGRAAALKALKAWSTATQHKDLDTLRTLMNEDIVIELPFNESGKTDKESYRIYRGIEACLGFWAVAFKAEGEMHAPSETELTVSSDGSRLFLETRGHLTMSTGKTYRNRYVMRLDIKDGRVSHVKEYYNPIQSAYAFGRPVAGKFIIDEL
jgi:ketosteroid isomerase-like protein